MNKDISSTPVGEAPKDKATSHLEKALQNLIREVAMQTAAEVKRSISAQIQQSQQPKDEEKLLTREETAKFFKVSYPTLYNWVANNVLTMHRIGGRSYFKYSEIKNAAVKSKGNQGGSI